MSNFPDPRATEAPASVPSSIHIAIQRLAKIDADLSDLHQRLSAAATLLTGPRPSPVDKTGGDNKPSTRGLVDDLYDTGNQLSAKVERCHALVGTITELLGRAP